MQRSIADRAYQILVENNNQPLFIGQFLDRWTHHYEPSARSLSVHMSKDIRFETTVPVDHNTKQYTHYNIRRGY